MKWYLMTLIVLLISCNKHKNKDYDPDVITQTATVVYQGSLTVDGCEWCIQTDATHFYHPDVLATAFQQQQLQVEISYKLTNDYFACGLNPHGRSVIHVVDIKVNP